MNFVVLYDACVLYPAPIRDLLMEVAVAGLVRAKWTKQIESEWVQNLLANRPDIEPWVLSKTAEIMIQAVPDCLVENYQALIPVLQLPDENDRHVLAAAINCGAQVIVTMNLKDFPADVLNVYDLEAAHPDTFLINQLDLSTPAIIAAVKRIRSRLKKPEISAKEYIDNLASLGLPGFSDRLKDSIELI